MAGRKIRIFHIVAWESGVVVRAVRAVRAGCCVANAGVPLFALRGVGGFR